MKRRPRPQAMRAAWVLLLCAQSCGEDTRTIHPPQILLRVYSTDEVRGAMDTLRVTVAVELDRGDWRARKGADVPSRARPWPIDIPVVPEGGSPQYERFEIVVEALEDEEVLVQTRGIARWFEHGTRILEVWLDRCGDRPLGALCEADRDCLGDTCMSCVDPAQGSCGVVQEFPAARLLPFDPDDGAPRDRLLPPWRMLDGGSSDLAVDGGHAGQDGGSDEELDAAGPKVPDGSGAEIDAAVPDVCADLDCDDENPCTVDGCEAQTGCVHDGTGVTAACAPDDGCGANYVCRGDPQGTCAAQNPRDCSQMDDACHVGACNPLDGSCYPSLVMDTTPCEDGDACTAGETCTAGVCAGGVPVVCDDSNECTDDSCDMALGCVYASNTDSCDDGDPCTVADRCSAGLCKSSPKDCSGLDADCVMGLCNSADGTCIAEQLADAVCDDDDSCTTGDHCMAGVCVGEPDACGLNASACTPGSPNACVCKSGYVDGGEGTCVPLTNECTLGICHRDANCTDPSNATGDVVCTCRTGFAGDGRASGSGCTDIDECAPKPCGDYGSCTQGIPGTYSCSCGQGYRSIGGECVCDLNGLFAARTQFELRWSGISQMEDSGIPGPLVESFALWNLSQSVDGTVDAEVLPCGSTNADICGLASPLLAAEAYAQFVPPTLWDGLKVPMARAPVSTTALPGATFTTPPIVFLVGISLADPLGPWPASRAEVNGGVNGATWIDVDGDAKLGFTSYAVPPGGTAAGGTPPPPQVFGATSQACPRLSGGAPRLAYNYWPGLEGLTVRRIKRFYEAARTIATLDAQLTSCDRVDGMVGGPSGGPMQNDYRIGGCTRVNGGGESECSSQLVDFWDTSGLMQEVIGATFIAKRVAAGTTCAQARALGYP